MTKRKLAVEILKSHLGVPYKWGGNDTINGFDCSGLIINILKRVKIFENDIDYTAHQLSSLFPETEIFQAGNLVFWDWDKDGIIDHVEMIALVDEDGYVFTIGAISFDNASIMNAIGWSVHSYVELNELKGGYSFVTDPF